ncbi:MAG TPA: endopeptidase La [Candidatus Butyricicoccus stercorigallinarum]|nr:endopeptidase La [Candidatus Butyricicoccus stercorigallinarum]
MAQIKQLESERELEFYETLPVLPLRGLVAFPDMLIHFDVGRLISMKALEQSMKDNQRLFLTAQRDIRTDSPDEDDLYVVGTVCTIKQILKLPGDNIRVLVEGTHRAVVETFAMKDDCLFAKVFRLETDPGRTSQRRKQALVRTLQERFEDYAALSSHLSRDVVLTVLDGGEPGYLADYVAQNTPIEYDIKQELLEELRDVRRLEQVIRIIGNEIEILRIESDLQEKLKEQVDKNQREYYLREQMKVIQSELGEQDFGDEVEEYREKICALKLPKESEEKLLKEAGRLEKMQPLSAESGVIRTYLDTCLELPWNTTTEENINLAEARRILDRDHYGLDKVKDRILEFLAVKSLAPQLKGQVLCLVGPPGVGKTSVVRSVAEAMGRKYARMSLGGVRDEADIRGHRKTYIGAMPGRIMNALSQAGSKNCLLLMDEIDKMGADSRGDPAAALLEVLDIEQNNAFRDHFIELPFDLSDVLFVTTANTLDTIPRPLLDRMEVIEISSYTEQEKAEIAMRHLLPKQLEKHGLKKSNLSLSRETMVYLIDAYTREAGVRRLEQMIARVCRKAAKIIADDLQAKGKTETRKRVTVTRSNMEKFLGTPRYKQDNVSKKDEVGVVNGLAWTSVGGEMLQVEVNVIPGTGKVEITGNLGKVMEESARAAVTCVRSSARELGVDPMFYKDSDIHIHFPEAAIPKDGPSAGVTMTTAIASAVTGIPVRHDVAMTGEVTLRGRVMPIGGLKEKTMAAYRAGIKTVIVPAENEPDLQDIDPTVRKNLEFVTAETMKTVLDTALRRPAQETARAAEPHTALPVVPSAAPARITRQGEVC